MTKIGSIGLLALAGSILFSGGCISKYKNALQEREMKIQQLEEERTELKAALDEARARERLLSAQQATARKAAPVQEASFTTPKPAEIPASDDELALTKDQLEGTGVESEIRNGRVVLTLPGEITFPSGKARLTSQGQEVLRRVSRLLNDQYAGRTIWVEGHTDNVPIRKSGFKSNRHLSFERAVAVSSFLNQKGKIQESRLVVAAHGEFSPIADNSTASGRKKNRRVEIIIGD